MDPKAITRWPTAELKRDRQVVLLMLALLGESESAEAEDLWRTLADIENELERRAQQCPLSLQ